MLELVQEHPDARRSILQHSADIVRGASAIGQELSLVVISGTENGAFLAFVEWPDALAQSLLDQFLKRWEKQIRNLIPGSVFHVGISSSFRGTGGFAAAYEEAMLAKVYCRGTGDQCIFFENARTLRIMSSLSGHPAVKEDAEKVLAQLLAYDTEGGSMELMRTLSVYIRSNYNLSETARELCIHRQSLLARIRRIEEMTGLSLKDHDDLFILEVYSRLYMDQENA